MKMKSMVLCSLVSSGMLLASEPVLRVGFMTDTHLKRNASSCNLVQKALELFLAKKVDMFVNLGDISDLHYPEAYRNYRKVINEVFKDVKPVEVHIYANHDTIGMPDWDTAFEAMKKELEIKNEPYDRRVLKGYPFLIFPQRAKMDRYEKAIQDAIAEFPGKPIFILDHVPAFDTVDNSRVWGSKAVREVLDKYPQVVQFSGHVHGSIRNELNIWQGNFTAVNAGCLQVWGGDVVGTAPSSKASDGVLIMEVFTDKLVVRRYELEDMSEYNASEPWSIPLPFSKEKAPYNFEYRKAKAQLPVFAAGASVKVLPVGTPWESVTFSFPEALQSEEVYKYQVALERQDAQQKWVSFARKDEFGAFYLRKKPAEISVSFSAGFFEAGQKYRVMVSPVNFYGGKGAPITNEFTAQEILKGEVRFESVNPMEDCPFLTGLEGGNSLSRCDGDKFYLHDVHNGRLVFPEHVWDGPEGTRFRFTIDMRMIQDAGSQWTLVLRNPTPLTNANSRIYTPDGDSGLQRYVIEFSKRADFNYYFLIREGSAGKIRFEHVKIELLPKK